MPRDSPIRTGKDFNNQTISTPAIVSISSYAIGGWIDQHGGDSKTVKLVEIPITASLAAVESGRVAAAELAYPTLALTQEHGMHSGAARGVHPVPPARDRVRTGVSELPARIARRVQQR